jgi:hypothetical protein
MLYRAFRLLICATVELRYCLIALLLEANTLVPYCVIAQSEYAFHLRGYAYGG